MAIRHIAHTVTTISFDGVNDDDIDTFTGTTSVKKLFVPVSIGTVVMDVGDYLIKKADDSIQHISGDLFTSNYESY